MSHTGIPENLIDLYQQEEALRGKAIVWIAVDTRLSLHLSAIEQAMNLADVLRQFETQDEDLRVIQLLCIRSFNAFGASLKLALSGYSQNSALVMRDILETVFLLDLFQSDRKLIGKWRIADKKTLKAEFGPAPVRIALDDRDGFTSKKREDIYKLFSELAGHPTMKSALMLRPQKDGDAVSGPFLEKTILDAIVSEMGKLSIQVGELIELFLPENSERGVAPRKAFAQIKNIWLAEFFPRTTK